MTTGVTVERGDYSNKAGKVMFCRFALTSARAPQPTETTANATEAAAIAAVASQPSTFHLSGSTIGPITLRLPAATITATITGTEITALITADQYSAEIGFTPESPMARPTTMAAARMP